MRTDGFLDQIDKSRAEVRRLKEQMPHIFPQWQRLEHAKSSLELARRELAEAQRAWNNVGAIQ